MWKFTKKQLENRKRIENGEIYFKEKTRFGNTFYCKVTGLYSRTIKYEFYAIDKNLSLYSGTGTTYGTYINFITFQEFITGIEIMENINEL